MKHREGSVAQVIDLLRNGVKPSGAGRRSCANADDCLYKWNTSKLNTPLVRVQVFPIMIIKSLHVSASVGAL